MDWFCPGALIRNIFFYDVVHELFQPVVLHISRSPNFKKFYCNLYIEIALVRISGTTRRRKVDRRVVRYKTCTVSEGGIFQTAMAGVVFLCP